MNKFVCMRIYLKEDTAVFGEALYKTVIKTLQSKGVAGATVFRGIMGYGHHGHLHTANILDIKGELPMVVEALDTEEKILAAMPKVKELCPASLITFYEVQTA